MKGTNKSLLFATCIFLPIILLSGNIFEYIVGACICFPIAGFFYLLLERKKIVSLQILALSALHFGLFLYVFNSGYPPGDRLVEDVDPQFEAKMRGFSSFLSLPIGPVILKDGRLKPGGSTFRLLAIPTNSLVWGASLYFLFSKIRKVVKNAKRDV